MRLCWPMLVWRHKSPGHTPTCKPQVIMPERTPPKADDRTGRPRSSWPWWVRLSLSGLSTRASARFCLWFAVLLALGCALLGLAYQRKYAAGIALLVAAWGYDRAITWVDRNG